MRLLFAGQKAKIIEVGIEDQHIPNWPKLIGKIIYVDSFGFTTRTEGYLTGGAYMKKGENKETFEYYHQIKVVPFVTDKNIILGSN